MTSAQRYDLRRSEQNADERRSIEASGGVAPFADGTPKTIIRTEDDGYRAACSCGYTGTLTEQYIQARTEARNHRCEGVQ